MVNRMRHNRSHRGNVRSHHALKATELSVCPDCGAKKLNHKVCSACGKYKGRVVIDVMAKVAKKTKASKKETKETK